MARANPMYGSYYRAPRYNSMGELMPLPGAQADYYGGQDAARAADERGQAPYAYGFGRNADGTPAVETPEHRRNFPNGPIAPGVDPNGPDAPQRAAAKRSHTYTGSALAYYGTGDIEGAEDVVGGSYGSTGVNTKGWETKERGSNSIKNVSMKIATRYPPKPSSIDLWLADPDTKRFFPNAKKVGFDKVDFGDGKPVDVLKAADPNSDTAEAWAFMPDDPSTAAVAGSAASRTTPPGTTPPGGTPNSTQPVGPPSGMNPDAYRHLAQSRRYYPTPTMGDWVDGPVFGNGNDEGFF